MSHLLEKLLAASLPRDWNDVAVVVAVSGGPDSTALLRAAAKLRLSATRGESTLWAAHFNHCWRGDASDADEAFVRGLCSEYGIPLTVGRAGEVGATSEETARNERYRFLLKAAGELGARYIATAHTRDDQVETILHRILRGTGPGGLRGIPRSRRLSPDVTLIRPLLDVTRSDAAAYLAELGQPSQTDTTNFDRRRTRSRIRHDLLPLLREQYNDCVEDAILRLSQLAGDAQDVIDRRVELFRSSAVGVHTDGCVTIEVAKLPAEEPHLIRELFVAVWRKQNWPRQGMGAAEWDALAQMAAEGQNAPQRDFPGGVSAAVQGGYLRLKPTVAVNDSSLNPSASQRNATTNA